MGVKKRLYLVSGLERVSSLPAVIWRYGVTGYTSPSQGEESGFEPRNATKSSLLLPHFAKQTAYS